MNLYVGTLGQLVIVELFVLWIWVGVLFDTMRDRAVSNKATLTTYNKLLLTSVGLVLNALAITGIMAFRVAELISNNWPFVWGIVFFYVVLALGNFMFILSATIGSNMKLLKVFFAVTAVWTAFILFVDIV